MIFERLDVKSIQHSNVLIHELFDQSTLGKDSLMPSFGQIENVYTLLSYKDYYGAKKTPGEILGSDVSLETLSQISILSYLSSEEGKFRAWAKAKLPPPVIRDKELDDRHVFGRMQILECWKFVLIQANRTLVPKEGSGCSLGMLHELLTHINDYEIVEDGYQYLIKSAITHARDDFKYKLYRAHKIFIEGESIARYVQIFQGKSGFSVENYINIIHMIIVRCFVKRSAEQFEVMSFSDWVVDLRKASQETGIDLQLLISVMKSVSFDLSEGAEFSSATISQPGNHYLFRDKPFVRLSETEYLPLEGRFVEELLFDNLFHKIHLASGKSKEFLDGFGVDFERYVQGLCEVSCALKKSDLYEYIPEFKYGKTESKSPDAMILCSRNKTLLAFEVKASRYLDSILSSDDNHEAIEKSFHKLRYKPWEQVHTALRRVVLEKRNPKIAEGLSCLFISVTMNEIPISLEDHKIIVGDRDVSYCFYSLGIHTLELLLSSAIMQDAYTLYDLLRNAYGKRHNISTKTFLLRFYRGQRRKSALDLMVAKFVAEKHGEFMCSHKYLGDGSQ